MMKILPYEKRDIDTQYRDVMALTAKRFNEKFNYHWKQIINFLKLHYVLNQQDDNGYWQANRQLESVPESLQASLNLWRHQPPWLQDAPQFDEMFPSASFQFVLYGMGFITKGNSVPLRSATDDLTKANKLFAENLQKTDKLQSVLPSNRELLNKISEFGFPKI